MFSQAFRSIWRNKLSSFLSALTTGFALFLLGTSFLVSINLGFMYQMAETQMEIQLIWNKELLLRTGKRRDPDTGNAVE